MKNITLTNKLFFTVAAFWYFTFFSGIYFSLSIFDSAVAGRIYSIVDSLVMLTLFFLFGVVLKNSIKNHDYILTTLSILLIIWPIFWMYFTIYDTFFLFNTPYAKCMQEFNNIVLCEGK